MQSRRMAVRDGVKWVNENGSLHRIDGPAFESTNGDKYWFVEGKCHRLDGPAIEHADGLKLWYIDDVSVECNSQEEFERLIKLKVFW